MNKMTVQWGDTPYEFDHFIALGLRLDPDNITPLSFFQIEGLSGLEHVPMLVEGAKLVGKIAEIMDREIQAAENLQEEG